eukprot:NODE_1537_length_860_cov_275.087546_g1192_i0.p1 GENE.NODE_1537_length_860_cov_275.087546_g1192_i0~~NODE_1537_length_860_cov_275.087546_g1192_i0.p1  ORF type:complete len:205 (+),score=27.28 NODE_1537_length_860_cov_275.087546_g1192_i0:78-617(+)
MSEASFRKVPWRDYTDVPWGKDIVLETNDESAYAMSREAIGLSKLLSEDLSGGEAQTVVPLANVDAPTFESVAEYLCYYAGKAKPATIEKPLKAALPELLEDFDKKYVYQKLFNNGVEKEHAMLFNTLKAANFLGIEPLRDLCCAAIANMLRSKTPEQICQTFGVTEPFTPEEHRMASR